MTKTAIIAGVLAVGASGAVAQNTAGAAATVPTMASAGTDSLAVARKYTAWFFTGQVDSRWVHQSPEAKKNNTPATSHFSGGGESFMVRMVLTPQGEFAGFGFNPRSQAPAIDR